MAELDDVSGAVIDCALRVHRELRPGLLENIYEVVLARALERRGLHVARQVPIRVTYEDLVFDEAVRADLIVHGCVIVELKSIEKLGRVHFKQLLTYLRLAQLRVGLLINFGAPTLKEGLHRVVNGLDPSASPRLRVNRSGEA